MEPHSKSATNLIILVHGTFARGARWSRKNSNFSQRLTASLGQDYSIESFEWNGRNSHIAREEAALKLVKKISGGVEGTQGRVFLIGHSHGGNVCLYAARGQPREKIGGIICMNTPFLSCRLRRLEWLERLIKAGMLTFLGTAIQIPFLALVALRGDLNEFSISVSWALALGMSAAYRERAEILLQHVQCRVTARQNQIVARIQLPETVHAPVYVAKVKGDEAYLYLRCISIASNAIFWFRTAVGKFGRTLFIAFYLYMLTFLVTDPQRATLHLWDATSYAFMTLELVLAIAVILMPKIIRGFRWGFGDSLWDNLVADIGADEVPPYSGFIYDQLTIRRRLFSKRLRHSMVYEDEELVDRIVRWIESPGSSVGPDTRHLSPVEIAPNSVDKGASSRVLGLLFLALGLTVCLALTLLPAYSILLANTSVGRFAQQVLQGHARALAGSVAILFLAFRAGEEVSFWVSSPQRTQESEENKKPDQSEQKN